ncbi:MAG: leucine-rich repeat protein, partial [Oscillospiraceae bacterium]|nr:leucine-rich repeat protein [Oscillospiraceae bacterium]
MLQRLKKTLAMLLCFALIVGLFPGMALAESGEETKSVIAPAEPDPAKDPSAGEGNIMPEEPVGADAPGGPDALITADEIQEAIASGACGDDLTWTLDEAGTLIVSGTGAMWDWQAEHLTPWAEALSSIRSVVLQEGVTSVGACAFSWNDQLASVELPDSLLEIGFEAFGYCPSLTAVDLPEGLKLIGGRAFTCCEQLTDPTFPSTLELIGGSAYSNCISLRELELPASLRTIGSYAFYYCTGLRKVDVAEGLQSIGTSAFDTCIALEELRFAGDAPSFGEEVFASREPQSVTAKVYYPKDNETWYQDVMYYYGGSITWVGYLPDPSTVKVNSALFPDPIFRAYVSEHFDTDGDGCLSETEIAAAKIVDLEGSGVASLVGIEYLTELEELNASGDFDTDGRLTELDLSANTKLKCLYLGFNRDLLSLDVTGLPALESLMVGNCNLIELDLSQNTALRELWCDNNNLETLDLSANSSLEHLDCCGNYAIGVLDLRPCPALVEAYLSGGRHISWMEQALPDLYEQIWVYGGTGDDDYVLALNSDMYVIAVSSGQCGDALYWSFDDETATLTVTGAGEMWDFETMGPWEPLWQKIEKVVVEPGATSIGVMAFCCCHKLESVQLPDTVTKIAYQAFADCGELSELILPAGLEEIETAAFQYCWALPELSIPEHVTTIGSSAFAGCYALERVTLPDSLRIIESGAFGECRGLSSVTIPSGVAEIGGWAFSSCSGLTEIRFEGSAPTIGENAFRDVTATAYYPVSDPSWTEDVRQNYGGTITWAGYEPQPERIPGDINGDGKVTVADVTLLAKYVKAKGQGVTIVPGAGNVDGSADGR